MINLKNRHAASPAPVPAPAPDPTPPPAPPKPSEVARLLAARATLMERRAQAQKQQQEAEAELRQINDRLRQPATLAAVDAIAQDTSRKVALERVVQKIDADARRLSGDLDTNAKRLLTLGARITALKADITAKGGDLAPGGLYDRRIAEAEAALRTANAMKMKAEQAQLDRKALLTTLGDDAQVPTNMPNFSRGRVSRPNYFGLV